jgi:hypothetical protein
VSAWSDLPQYLRVPGMSNKWIGNDNQPDVWHISGFNEGAEGVFISGPIKGLVHRPFKSIWHEPAYGAPRFERTVDERKEISTRIAICSDSEYGWQDVETKWWNGCNGDQQGFWCTSTRRTGELWLPMQLAEAVQTDLTEDPGYSNYIQEWDILLCADGDPRWRMPDLQPADFVNKLVPSQLVPGTFVGNPITTTIRRDDSFNSPMIPVGVGKFRVANRGTAPAWPVFTLSAPTVGRRPARWWISNGSTANMIKVPPIYKGEHLIVDTNPENRIAISAIDPVDDWTKQIIRNSELLSWLNGQYGESGISVLERFNGQGFTEPIAPGTVATLTVYCDTDKMRASVRLPQRYERAVS